MSAVSLSVRVDAGVIGHNNRDFIAKNVNKDKVADNITYVKKDLKEVYQETFGKALEEYNAKQKRSDRVIKDYYEHIKNSNQEKLFYEAVIQFGNIDNSAVGTEGGEVAKKMLDDYMKDFIQAVSRKVRISFNSPNCIFVNNTDGACTIYEARPLICRKYGLYGNLTDCKKLNSENLLCAECNTAENTLYFRFSNKPNARILSKPNRIVYWFANTENGLPSADKMKALYKASYAQNIDTFIELLLC